MVTSLEGGGRRTVSTPVRRGHTSGPQHATTVTLAKKIVQTIGTKIVQTNGTKIFPNVMK